MNDVRDWLKAADPVVSEPPPSDHDVDRMRRAIVAATEGGTPSRALWGPTSWAAATVVIAITAGIGISRWSEPRAPQSATPSREMVTKATSEPRRQVQLVAPGGTRVIWIFNADFKP